MLIPPQSPFQIPVIKSSSDKIWTSILEYNDQGSVND